MNQYEKYTENVKKHLEVVEAAASYLWVLTKESGKRLAFCSIEPYPDTTPNDGWKVGFELVPTEEWSPWGRTEAESPYYVYLHKNLDLYKINREIENE